jgi:hypothetical protein
MTVRPSIAMQISMHPRDTRIVRELLPHQLRAWHGQVDAVDATIDTHLSGGSHYRDSEYVGDSRQLKAFLEELKKEFPKLTFHEVDYGPLTRAVVSAEFFGSKRIPLKAWDGGPIFAYFEGLHAARADHVLHMDCDMLFGGGSQIWLDEAVAMMRACPHVLFASPLSGPPRPDGTLGEGHTFLPGVGAVAPPRRLDMPFPAWQFSTVSTRIFLLDVARFRERVQALPVIPPALHLRLKALRHGNPPQAIPAEAILSTVLRQHGLHRVDMLGSGSGMWSLHPTSRTTTFFQGLPDLIARVEAGDIPDAQRGEFDVHDALAN